VPPDWLDEIDATPSAGLSLHAHACEAEEVDDCLAACGVRPIELPPPSAAARGRLDRACGHAATAS
jgi:hypothetical protein